MADIPLFFKNKHLILDWIKNFFSEKDYNSDDVFNQIPEHIKNKFFDFVSRGKCIRGSLLLTAYNAAGGDKEERVLGAAAALEIFHSGFLIKDDIMDGDELRRGQASMHIHLKKHFSDTATSPSNSFSPGISIAVCVSDLAYFLAMEALLKARVTPETSVKLMNLFSSEIQRVGSGQIFDIINSMNSFEITEEKILTCYKNKTARYTFSLPFSAGVICAEGNNKLRADLEKAGEMLGLIFQIKDDELGLTGTHETTGKPAGSDIREGKATLHLVKLMQVISENERKTVISIVGNPEASDSEIKYITELMLKYDVMDSIGKFVEDLSYKIDLIIEESSFPASCRKTLKALLDYSVRRGK